MNSPTHEQIMMKEDLNTFNEVFSYEEGCFLSEVKASMQRKQLINTCAIVVAITSLERNEIFSEDNESRPHFPLYFFLLLIFF